MKAFRVVGTLLVSVFLLSTHLFSQSLNATVSGTIADTSGAVLPSVTVTGTNNATGVVATALSNGAGVYNLPGLLPGVYKISAELPGFKTYVFSNIQLGNQAQVRLNFALEVGAVAQTVEVTAAAENAIITSSSSVGEVLPQKQIEDLPLVSNNILDLVGVMAGVYMTNDAVFGAENTTFAGVSARDINVQRDGISINNGRWPNGLDSPTRMNPDLVGEVRMILAPVDAEMGRGNGQLQIQTRSGTNLFKGAAVWNVQNSVLDANTWQNKSLNPVVTPPWRNQHEYNLAFGGPIKKNKTFFYTLWDQQIVSDRQEVFPTVLTDCARLGIFRYYDNINNGNSRQIAIGGATPTAATVNRDGSPLSPNGGPLRYLSVFGALASNPTKNDCSDAQISGTTLVPNGAAAWDPSRTALDTSGFIQKNLTAMPHANAFDNPGNLVASTGFFGNTYAPDGLNMATHRWVQTARGADNLFGVGQANGRRQINVKLDHNFTDRHKINASYSYEIDVSDDAALPPWPGILNGQDLRHPQVLSVNFTSVLSPSLVNEARFGLSRTGANTGGLLDRTDVGAKSLAQLPQVNNEAVITNIGFQALGSFGYGIGGSLQYASHEVSPRWTYADTISWTRGTHSFKAGGEFRTASTKSTNGGTVQGGPFRPSVAIGNAQLSPVVGIARANLAGAAGSSGNGNTQAAENVLTFLSGSLSSLQQARFINSLSAAWADPLTNPFKIRDIHQNEFGSFFKDDWKATRDLTLNLGVRWDYYGVPWEKSGLTTALAGGGNALFGLSGRSYANWMQPGIRGDLMNIIYVGPHSPNSSQSIYNKDFHNFGPAVGFAWQVPWGGKGKTTVRGGYQIQYLGGGRGFVLDTAIGNPPGSSNTANYFPPGYFSLATLAANPALIPVQPTFLPSPTSTIIPVTDRTGLINAFDPAFTSPYIQNFTLSVTRNLTSKLTMDLRYIGTLSRKMYSNVDLNAPNFLYNGLKQAFDAARKGGESPLLDQLFKGLNIAGNTFGSCQTNTGAPTPCAAVGTVNSAGVLQTGAMHLRAAPATQVNLANGNYVALATTLNTMQDPVAGFVNGSVLRYANAQFPGAFPENFIVANPQVANSVMESNLGHANYHSLQAQFTLRPVAGVSTQTSYTFSRNLGEGLTEGPNGAGQVYTDPTHRGADYTLAGSNRKHVLVNYGTFALPVGPNKLFFGGAHGLAARLLENWQSSWIVNLSSGSPAQVVAQSMLYGNGVPDIAGPFNVKQLYKWAQGSAAGNLYADANGNPLYKKVQDPQCTNPNYVAPFLAVNAFGGPNCTLNAIANNSNGQVVLQTPLPGTRGNFGQNRLQNLGTWTTDMAVQKRVQFGEKRSMTVRMDASNVFNHPTPGVVGTFFADTAGTPDVNLTDTAPFGNFMSKVGHRTFQLKARVDF
jgi:Carboxypeptidase regulatory-like domain/TonB-dependent Receptor Plug Domain